MALTKVSIYEADQAGMVETISVQADNTTLSTAFYGKDASGTPKPVDSIANDGKSLKFTVIRGKVPLTMNFISPVAEDDVVLYQGDPDDGELAEFMTSNGIKNYVLFISGT